MGLLDFALTITPSIVAVIAVIVPAIQNVKLRKIESQEREREHLISSWACTYSDFCKAFAQLRYGDSNDAALKFAEAAFKLSAICDEKDSKALINFAEYALSDSIEVDVYTLMTMFENCARIVRKNLKREDTQLPQKSQHT